MLDTSRTLWVHSPSASSAGSYQALADEHSWLPELWVQTGAKCVSEHLGSWKWERWTGLMALGSTSKRAPSGTARHMTASISEQMLGEVQTGMSTLSGMRTQIAKATHVCRLLIREADTVKHHVCSLNGITHGIHGTTCITTGGVTPISCSAESKRNRKEQDAPKLHLSYLSSRTM